MTLIQRGTFIQKNKILRAQVAEGKVRIHQDISYIHSGDEFIVVHRDGDILHVRWSEVAEYRVKIS